MIDYKKILPNQEVRLKLLKLIDFLPDKWVIQLQYWIKTGRKLNLKNPVRFTEKLQWYKLNYRNPLMTKCSDKFEVRDFVKSKGYPEILVPLFGVYDSPEDIKFDKLPEKFVLKTTNGSHTNIICEDKSKLNIAETKKILIKWLNAWESKVGREWSYFNIKPRIICEKFIEKDKNNDLVDYKFFCFHGNPFYCYVIKERFSDSGLKLGIYDINFNKLPYKRADIKGYESPVEKPKGFNIMIQIAKKLSEDFPHVRVDLYNVDGKIFFGELTFYDGSGYQGFEPDDFDFILGEEFKLLKF
jgi:hypothetical protein